MKHTNVLVLTIAAFCLYGCKTVPIDPNDSSAPKVQIQIKGSNGQYAPAPASVTISASSGRIDLLCKIDDPQGVKTLVLNYSGTSDSCTNDGDVSLGVYPIKGLPDSLGQTLKGDAMNKVLTTLPLFSTLQGPLTCSILGVPSQTGTPFGSTVKVTCSGLNWSANNAKNSASATLDVELH